MTDRSRPCAIAIVIIILSGLAARAHADVPPQRADAPQVPRAEWPAACEANVAAACNFLGMAHDVGVGAEHDPARAAVLYRKACDLGSGWGCHNLVGTVESMAARATLLQKACNLGYAKACHQLGGHLARGAFGAAQVANALPLYQRGCDLGFGEACHALALHYDAGDLGVRDQPRSARLLGRACDLDAMASCFLLAQSHLAGKGHVARDVPRALALLTKACGTAAFADADIDKMPSGEACRLLAAHVEPARARELLARACQFGAEEACWDMAERFASGSDGLARDAPRSLSFLRHTCDQREAHLIVPPVVGRACNAAGARLRAGEPATAADLFRRACELENAEGCNNLARAHTLGEGVPADQALGSKARSEACRLGYKPACDYIRCSITLGCVPRDGRP